MKRSQQPLLALLPSLKGLRLITPQVKRKRTRKRCNARYRLVHAKDLAQRRKRDKQRIHKYNSEYYAKHKEQILRKQRDSYSKNEGRFIKYAQALRRQGYIVISPQNVDKFLSLDSDVIRQAIQDVVRKEEEQ